MAAELRAESDTPPASGTEPVTEVYELDEELVVVVRLQDGLLELRVPRQAVSKTYPYQCHIPGFNSEATPC